MHEVRITLNQRFPPVRRYLERPYLFHQMLEGINTKRTRVLWRLVRDRLLIRSNTPLDWAQLDHRYPDFGDRAHTQFSSLRKDGEKMVVNIRAYARKRPITGKWQPKTTEEYLEWFDLQSDRYGFQVLESTVVRQEAYRVETSSMPITLLPAEILAAIQVVNAQQLQSALEEGIGRMRAYGCGLMMVRTG